MDSRSKEGSSDDMRMIPQQRDSTRKIPKEGRQKREKGECAKAMGD